MYFLKLLVCALSITITAELAVRAQLLESLNISKLSDAVSSFSFELYACWLYNHVKNIYVSPMSVMQVLSAFHFGLRGKSEKLFSEVLGYTKMNMTKIEIMEAFYLLTTQYFTETNRRTIFNSSSTFLVKKEVELIPAFKHFAEAIFQVSFTVIDTEKSPEKMIEHLNQWVATRTRNKMTNVLNEIRTAEDVIALNVIYFKASWRYRFSRRKTVKDIFFNNGIPSRTRKIPMMHMTRYLKHHSATMHRIMELPFKKREVSMYIFLPKFMNGIHDTELDLVRSINEDLPKMKLEYMKVTLPKFKFHSSAYLSTCLSAMNDGKPFIPDSDDLSVMFRNKSLSLGEMYHKAGIEVTEEGIDVPPDTSDTCFEPPITLKNSKFLFFKVNHPFVFIIKDLRTNIILFIGRVEEI